MNVKQEVVILSAELSHLDDNRNIDRTNGLKFLLERSGLAFKEVIGVYKGTQEVSFVVTFKTISELAQLQEYANYYDQECILHVDQTRKATLIYPDSEQVIGKLKACTPKQASKQDASTYCPTLDQWYIVA